MEDKDIKIIGGIAALGLIGFIAYKNMHKTKRGYKESFTGNYYRFTLNGEGELIQYKDMAKLMEKPIIFSHANSSHFDDSIAARKALAFIAKRFTTEVAIKAEKVMFVLQSMNTEDQRIYKQTNAFMPVSSDPRKRNVNDGFGMGGLYLNPLIAMQKPLKVATEVEDNLPTNSVTLFESMLPDFFWTGLSGFGKWYMGYFSSVKFLAYIAYVILNGGSPETDELIRKFPQGEKTFVETMEVIYKRN